MAKTINASDATYEVLEQVKKDAADDLKIPISFSDAIQLASAAYFELKKLKIAERDAAHAKE